MKHIALFLIVISGICLGVFGQAAPDGIAARIYLVRGPMTEFKQNWSKPETPPVADVKDAKRGDDLVVAIFFSGQTLDRNSNAKVVYDITITAPDGKTYPNKDLVGIEGPMPREAVKDLYLGNAMVAAKLPTNSPLFPAGKYKFSAVVTDKVGVRESRTETVVEIK